MFASVDLFVQWKFKCHQFVEKVTVCTDIDLQALMDISKCTWIHHTRIDHIKCTSHFEEIEPTIISTVSAQTPLQTMLFPGLDHGELHFVQEIEVVCEEDLSKTRV